LCNYATWNWFKSMLEWINVIYFASGSCI